MFCLVGGYSGGGVEVSREGGFCQVFPGGWKVLSVHGGSNKAARFFEVAVYVEGGRKWMIWLLEGREGRGWRRVVGELSKLVAFLGPWQW